MDGRHGSHTVLTWHSRHHQGPVLLDRLRLLFIIFKFFDAGTNVRQTNVRQSNVRQSNVRQTNVRHVKCSTSQMFDIIKCSTLSNVRQSNVRHVLCSTSLMFDNQMFDILMVIWTNIF